MWAKTLAAVMIVLCIAAGWYLITEEGADEAAQEKNTRKPVPVVKEAKSIVMYERRLDSDWNFVIHAQTAQEEQDENYTLTNFRMDRSDGLKIGGKLAKYDAKASLVKVVGPMTVDTADGWRANLTDLVWDRPKKYAVTDKPVSVQGGKGWLRGNKAEFFDDFNQIQITGDVHAKVTPSALDR